MPLPDLTGWTIAFDLDGTLVDTAPDLVGTLNHILQQEGLDSLPFEEGRTMVGHGARALLEKGYAATGADLSPELLQRLFDQFIDHYSARIAQDSKPYNGCVEALTALSEAGATLVVCTNKPTNLSLVLLETLDMADFFAAIVGRDTAPAAKPDPRHLLFSIEEADGDPEMAIMVGDSDTDVKAAQNAAVPVVVMSHGYTAIPCGQLGADGVVDTYAELCDWIGTQVTKG